MTKLVPQGLSEQVGVSTEGNAVFLFFDSKTQAYRYVVRLPNGRFVYSDPNGVPLSPGDKSLQPVPAAVLGGMLGAFLGGPVGALIGGAALFALASMEEKKSAS